MKRILALILVLAALLLSACGGSSLKPAATQTEETGTFETDTETVEVRKVPSPAQAPEYTFDHDPSVDEMRAMAIRAMRDILTVQWYPEKTVRYNKSGAVSQKNFEFLKERYYMGLPYTSAGMGLFQFLEYYDGETGCLRYSDQATFNEVIGTSCAGAVGWGLLSVCSSVKGGNVSNYLTISNGYLPLGGVSYDPAITDFSEYFTKQIVRDNGDARVLAGYAAVQPGDVLVYGDDSEGKGHTRMAVAAANVVYKDGAIDPDASTITVQEQAANDIEDASSGITMIRSGQLEKSYSFASFLREGYIAVSTAEFLGKKAYEKCAVSFEGDGSTLEGFSNGTLKCNYPMAVLKVVLHTDEGDTVLKTVLFNRNMVGDGTAREFPVASAGINLSVDRRVPKSGAFTLSLEVTTSTGEVFTPAIYTNA